MTLLFVKKVDGAVLILANRSSDKPVYEARHLEGRYYNFYDRLLKG